MSVILLESRLYTVSMKMKRFFLLECGKIKEGVLEFKI